MIMGRIGPGVQCPPVAAASSDQLVLNGGAQLVEHVLAGPQLGGGVRRRSSEARSWAAASAADVELWRRDDGVEQSGLRAAWGRTCRP